MKKIFYFLVCLLILNISTSYFTKSTAQSNALQRSEVNTSISKFLSDELPEDINSKIESFFGLIIKKEYKSAFEKLFVNSPIFQKDIEVKDILEQMRKSTELYGHLKNYEIINCKIVGKYYYRISVLGLNQKYPTRWEFTFYRSPDLGLIISNFRFDDATDVFFE